MNMICVSKRRPAPTTIADHRRTPANAAARQQASGSGSPSRSPQLTPRHSDSENQMDDAWPHDDWFTQLADGEPQTVEHFWETYGAPMRRVAERQIAERLRTRVDADDIVQSACRTFFRRIGEGQFEIEDSESLWRLLLTITLNKARMQARFHTRDRRSIGREQAIPQHGAYQPAESESFLEKVDFADLLEFVIKQLDEEQRQILTMTLDGKTQLEISEVLGCSERTVRRMRIRIQDQLRDQLTTELGRDE